MNHIVGKATEFDPDRRYQTAAEMYADIKKVIVRLERGERTNVSDDPNQVGLPADEDDIANEGEGRVVMLVESQGEMQNVIRERLKSRGYRVLIISSPNRAIDRFADDDIAPADLVIFSTAELGELASKLIINLPITNRRLKSPRFCSLTVDRNGLSAKHVAVRIASCCHCL